MPGSPADRRSSAWWPLWRRLKIHYAQHLCEPAPLAGGVFVAAGISLLLRLARGYLNAVPTYSMVCGAFATLPIPLVWIYLSWVMCCWVR
jgi:hypothetical protein